MCRSISIAAPRAAVRDCSVDMPSTATGESFGSLIATDPLGSGASWAIAAAAHVRIANCRLALFRIHPVDCHKIGFRIHRANADCSLGIRGVAYVGLRIDRDRPHDDRMIAVAKLDAV